MKKRLIGIFLAILMVFSFLTLSVSAKSYIGAGKAKKIALKNAGVKKKNAKGIEVELEKEKGVRFYDVEFRAGSKEYDYEIDAERKTILEKSVENIKYR